MGVRPFISALLRNAKTKGLTPVAVRCREKGQAPMNYPAASCGVSKTTRHQYTRDSAPISFRFPRNAMVPFDKLRAGSAHHKDLTPSEPFSA